MADASQSAEEADTEAEERETYAWASQTPTTRISGVVTDIVYAGNLSDTTAQNDTSFGVVLSDPEVVNGSLFVNQEKANDGTTAEGVDDDQPRPTDYRIVDEDDRDTTIANGALVTDENGPNTYDEADGFDEDEILVWYNGLTGQRLSRLLDFNGQPYARWTDGDDPYLIKGLYQCAPGWREANGSKRGEMAGEGKAPRVARAPILRQRVEPVFEDGEKVGANLLDEPNEQRILVDMSRPQSGRGYRLHAFDAEQFEDEFDDLGADVPRNDAGYVKDDIESEIEWNYEPHADSVLEQAEYRMHMYTGDGWQDEPDSYTPQSTSEVGSFGIATDDGGDDGDGLSAEAVQFVEEVAQDLKGTGMTPEERYDGGISGLVGKHREDFSSAPDVDELREAIFAEVAHLDTSDLED